MGMAKFLGRDPGTPRTEALGALELAWYWLVGGLPLCFFISIFLFPTPNFIAPISVYGVGISLLFLRYLRIEQKDLNNGKRTD